MRPIKKWLLVLPLALYLLLLLWTWTSFHSQPSSSSSSQEALILLPEPNQNKKQPPRPPNKNPLERLSSVDYYACCGLGHRLIRLSLAAYIAKQHNFALRTFWGWCGEHAPIEVFSYLFRPSTATEVAHVTSRNLLLPFYNEVSGFSALVRSPTGTNNASDECHCQEDKIQSDLELYTSLRERFRQKQRVDAFVQEQFVNATVLGIHVRAGNGEGGDFVRKGRGIDNPEVWVGYVATLLQTFVASHQPPLSKPPVLYIATDTPSMIPLFRKQLAPYNIPVLDLPTIGRREEGQGVLFGVSDKVHNKGGEADEDDYSSCLQGWTDTLTDMFLLSHADVVIAGKPSSFSQTLPMSLAFGNTARTVKDAAYCEVIPQVEEQQLNATTTIWQEVSPKLQCYSTYLEWCCNYTTWIQFHHKGPKGHAKIHSKEFVKFLLPGQMLKEYGGLRNRTGDCLRPRRGRAGGGLKDKCLPHEW